MTEESLKTLPLCGQPVTIRLYVSEKLQSAWDELGAHAAQTTAFLARCVLAAPDKIRLEIRRIKPFSDMEKQAVSEGMLPFPENEEELYFGLKVIAADGRSALIPALKPERRALLESDLNRILHGLNEERKVKIGVFSPRLPFSPDGKGSAFASLAALLQEYYEVFEIPAGSSLVPQDISVVLALDPGRLPPVVWPTRSTSMSCAAAKSFFWSIPIRKSDIRCRGIRPARRRNGRISENLGN